ncbi:unnamed protein product [Symbiodinium sp. CCMP2592]|nr:unnamed protein product [Symbiodinium sp. CCMP2592]
MALEIYAEEQGARKTFQAVLQVISYIARVAMMATLPVFCRESEYWRQEVEGLELDLISRVAVLRLASRAPGIDVYVGLIDALASKQKLQGEDEAGRKLSCVGADCVTDPTCSPQCMFGI